jgi:hypothetical protein
MLNLFFFFYIYIIYIFEDAWLWKHRYMVIKLLELFQCPQNSLRICPPIFFILDQWMTTTHPLP